MKPEQLKANKAWAALSLGIVAYELACPIGETLSEGVDRALLTHRTATITAIGVTTLHLLNLLPQMIDPYHQSLNLIKKARNEC
jgi:hypothetical protein